MLKRRSIRTKLVVALTLLSAIVLLLASSGFWGLYRYEQLAEVITHRATEFQLAHDLHQSATELCSVRVRIIRHRSHQWSRSNEGLIESDLLDDPLTDPLSDPLINMKHAEESAYSWECDRFVGKLEAYIHRVDSIIGQEPLLIESDVHLASLRQIQDAYTSLSASRHAFPEEPAAMYHQSEKQHQILVDETSRHLESIKNGMEAFSDEVRGQCKVWIVIAYTCTIAAFLMMGLLIAAFRSLVVLPFRTLVDGSRLVAGGQYDHRIDLGTGDELSELAEAMNEMTNRFQGALLKVKSWCNNLDRQVHERTREVIQNEQLASVGFLAAGVAHEINNPLASIAWSAESLQSRAAELTMQDSQQRILDDELLDTLITNLRRIEDEAYRCKGITEKLLDFSRLSEVQRAPTNLVELVDDVVTMVGTVGKYRCKTIRTHATGPVVASVNPQEIRQVLLNLVTNALESVEEDGAVDIDVSIDDEHAVVLVRDDGCGMSSEVLRHLFEPFFTRRRDGTGTGLGLSITYRIVSQHGGSLVPSSEGEGRGSLIEMHLPLFNEIVDCNLSTTTGWSHESYQTS